MISKEFDIYKTDVGKHWGLVFMDGESFIGSLKLNFFSLTNAWVLDCILSARQGTGKVLIREFVNDVGPNIAVSTSCITEIETNLQLSDILRRMQGDRWVITDQNIISPLKFARLLNGGGIRVGELHVERGFRCEDSGDMIFMFGLTQ